MKKLVPVKEQLHQHLALVISTNPFQISDENTAGGEQLGIFITSVCYVKHELHGAAVPGVKHRLNSFYDCRELHFWMKILFYISEIFAKHDFLLRATSWAEASLKFIQDKLISCPA